jgi:hypothetical protein
MKSPKLAPALAALALAGCASFPAPEPRPVADSSCSPASAVEGAWANEPGETQVLFKGQEILFRKKGALSVASILKRDHEELQVRYQGLLATWKLTCSPEGQLSLQADEPLSLQRLAKAPAELSLDSPPFPEPAPIPVDDAKAVEQELQRRVGLDQQAVKDPALRAKRPEILADNIQYLRELTSRLGWIDIPRFGRLAASAAVLIAKHASDLPLMKRALPIVARDVKEHGGSGEMYSVLYDELQITLGRRQRYGTQFAPDDQGNLFVLPLEEPDKVNAYRKEIGILSFEEYLHLVSQNMGGAPVRVAGEPSCK